MKKYLFLKLFAGYLVIVLLVVAVMGYLTASNLRSDLAARTRGELAAFGHMLSHMSPADISKNSLPLARESQCRITLVDATGRVISDTEHSAADLENHLNRPEIQEARARGEGTAIRYSDTLRTDMIYFALALKDGDTTTGYLRLAKPVVELQAAAARLYRMLLQTILIALTPSLLIALVFFFRIVKPIRELEEYSRRAREHDGQARLMIDSDDEVGGLSKNINGMIRFQQEKIAQLREEKGKLEATFAGMMGGVMVLNSDNRIETCNAAMVKMVGPIYSDIIGKRPLEVLRSATLQNALDRFLETGKPVTEEVALGVDNRVILEVAISAIKGLPEGERKVMLVFHDVTQMRKLERMRADFVANVTHEIKTPLTALVGYSETLLKEKPDEALTERFLKKINENALRLDRLVDDLLTISDIELGETKINPEAFSLAAVVDEAVHLVKAQAEGKDLLIANSVARDFPPLTADKDKVFRVLLNVIGNAAKFTPSGKVEITASRDGRGCVVGVSDTGIGIPKEEIPRLGERFYRVDKARSRELGSTGLGLSIVKHLMNLHGGRIVIDSTPGSGTTVSLYFPEYRKAP